MNPATLLAVSQIISGAIKIWADNSGKPEGWVPAQTDWDELLALNEKTAEDYIREAQEGPPPV